MVTRNSSRCSLLRRAVDGYPLELPTIDERWGDPAKIGTLGILRARRHENREMFPAAPKHLPHE